MDRNLLKEEIKEHEGVVYGIYEDTLGLKTAGVGHLLREGEDKLDWSDPEVVEKYFAEDLDVAIGDARKFSPVDFDGLQESIQHALVNLSFNLGYNRLSKFRNFRAALARGDYQAAADELVDSKWYTQVGRRGPELENVFRTA